MGAESNPKGPDVRVPPPFLFIAGLIVAWLLDTRVFPLRFSESGPSPAPLQIAGVLLIALGLLCVASGMITFARAHTAIIPRKPASRLVDTGPYRYTRNPMYTGLSVAYAGGALLMNSVWALLLFPLVLITLYLFVIRREERYLSSAFGDKYEAYRRQVRRWI